MRLKIIEMEYHLERKKFMYVGRDMTELSMMSKTEWKESD